MEETGTDLMEVADVPGEVEENLGTDLRKEDDLSVKPVTEKMIYLMQKISEYGYLTRPEVELIYANQTHGYKVLGTLRSKGLIGDFETERQPKKAVYLKAKGYRTLETLGKLRLKRRFLPQHYKPFIFEHRLACAKAGLILDGHPLVKEFMPESLLWERTVQKGQKLCDAEFIYKTPQDGAQRVGLEVELTLKNRDKIDESLRALSNRENLAQVWWICADATILRALKTEVMKRYWNIGPRHLFCLMEDFLRLKHQAQFTDVGAAGLTKNPIEPTLRPLPPQLPELKPVSLAVVATQDQAPIVENRYEMERRLEHQKWVSQGIIERRLAKKEALEREQKLRRRHCLTITAAALGSLVLIGLARLAWKSLPPLFDNAPPVSTAPTWKQRRIKYPHFIANHWIVNSKSLYSMGNRYRFKVEFIKVGGDTQKVCGVTIYDSTGRPLKNIQLDDIDYREQQGFDGNFDFRGPPGMRSFGIGFWGGVFFCQGMSTQPEFEFEFK